MKTTRSNPLWMRVLGLALAAGLLLAGCSAPEEGPEESAPQQSSRAQATQDSGWSSPDKSKGDDQDAQKDGPLTPAAQHGDYLWQVTNGGSVVYLMGTMHVLKDDYRFNDRVLELFDAADALAVESNIKDEELTADSDQYYYYQDETNIYDHLSQEGRDHLIDICRQFGYPEQIFEMYNFTAYIVSSFFSEVASMEAGFSFEGVDAQLIDRAVEMDKPILNLETYGDIFRKLELLDDDSLERILILPLVGPEESVAELEELYELYLRGDDEAMLDYLYAEVETDIEYQEKDYLYNYYMITERNEIMTDSIEGYLSQPGTTFVAAGLAHFLGEDSIVELLTERGYEVQRL